MSSAFRVVAFVFDRFRDLEKAGGGRRLDVVLMATVSSFEALKRPTRHELRQFSELFFPLFRQVGRDTQRTAVAALSRCPDVPQDVVRLIAEQPIEVAAPYLANAAEIDDAAIAEIVVHQPATHARALARRRRLSPDAITALLATGDDAVLRSLTVRGLVAPDADTDLPTADARQENEETLRNKLRELVGKRQRVTAPVTVPIASPEVMTRLNRFAEEAEALFFATALADVLGCTFPFAERIMLDISGQRLAATMTAIGFAAPDIARALQAFFPHLRQRSADKADAWALAVNGDRLTAATDLARLLAASNGDTELQAATTDAARRAPMPSAENEARDTAGHSDVFDLLRRA